MSGRVGLNSRAMKPTPPVNAPVSPSPVKLCALALACALLLTPVTALAQKGSSQRKQQPSALTSLVETERAFARLCVERGVRQSFIAYFSDEGIGFQSKPVKTRAVLLSRPAPPARPPVTLDWSPVFGDVSRAGDLGFTTGPYVLSDDTKKEPPDFGYYFTVWRRQPDGAWRVALDLGVPVPAFDAHVLKAAPFVRAKPTGWRGNRTKDAAATTLAELRAAEAKFSALSVTDGAARAFDQFVTDDARFYRSDSSPVVGARTISDYLRIYVAKFSWEMIDGGASASGDFGYTYGSYELVPATGKGEGQTERGYYTRVWRRDAKGRWRAVMNVAHATPPEQK